jgi:hypothetical protein
MSGPSDLGRIKGVAFGEFLAWYEAFVNAEEVRGAVRRTHADFPDVFDLGRAQFGILASRWYRAEVVHAVLDRLILGKAERELETIARDAAEAIMTKTIRGVYRTVFALVITPDRYRKHIDKVWSLHYDTGRIVVEEPGPQAHRVRYEDWRSHHPMICRLNMAAGGPIYEAMGCRDVSVRRLGCVSDGARACENLVSWR